MAQRTNLNTKESPIKYNLGSILLLAMSGIGIFYLINGKKEIKTNGNLEVMVTPTETILVTPTTEITPTKEATKSVKLTATPTIKIASISATPTIKATLNFESKSDNFSVSYDSSRTLYQDKEASGDRFTFYNPKGNIAVHVGQDWSWVYSERTFSNGLLVDGVPTFVYEISNQKIVDFEKNGLKYTIQCVHNGLKELKTECDNFMAGFKFI